MLGRLDRVLRDQHLLRDVIGPERVVVDRGVRIPDGLVVGEDPELDAARFRRTDRGVCLITQPMIDQLGR